MAHDISSNAMLASLKISMWTARRFDRKITDRVNDEYAASRDAGRYNKCLLPGNASAYKAVVKAANTARLCHYVQTLSWSDEGARLLPTANFQTYSDQMRQSAGEFDAAVADFLVAYPTLKMAAQNRLNGLYLEADYPTTSEMPAKFRFEVRYAPIPIGSDFRLSLPESELAAIRLATESQVQAAVTDAMTDAWSRLRDVVSHVHERLSTPGAIFRDSLIENVRELTSALSCLNLTGDSALEAMRAEVETALAGVDPQTLRHSDVLRGEKAAQARAILAKIQGVMGS